MFYDLDGEKYEKASDLQKTWGGKALEQLSADKEAARAYHQALIINEALLSRALEPMEERQTQ